MGSSQSAAEPSESAAPPASGAGAVAPAGTVPPATERDYLGQGEPQAAPPADATQPSAAEPAGVAASAASDAPEAAAADEAAAATTAAPPSAPGPPGDEAPWSLNAGAPEFVPGPGAIGFEDGAGQPAWAGLPAGTPEAAAALDWAQHWWTCAGTITPAGDGAALIPGIAPPPTAPADFDSRGLGHDSPRAALLTLCGAWGALATRKPLPRSTLLENRLAPRDAEAPEELLHLKCVALS